MSESVGEPKEATVQNWVWFPLQGAPKNHSKAKVRIEHSLNKEEKETVKKRRQIVLKNLKKLEISCSLDKVPNIALLGSGGGQRAMVSLLGSLVQLGEADLLDCVLYLSGVSGSTWCMASLYQEPDWSSKLETVKDKIVQRLSGPALGFMDLLIVLGKHYFAKGSFSLTEIWAVSAVTAFIKEVNTQTLTEMWNQQKDKSLIPYPIYTMTDKQCKQLKDGDPWFEVTPHEAGYSLTGAFVDTAHFGCQFNNGHIMKYQSEMDMLYLQALCGSAVADGEANIKCICKTIKDCIVQKIESAESYVGMDKDQKLIAEKCFKLLSDLVDLIFSIVSGSDQEFISATIKELSGQQVSQQEQLISSKIQKCFLDIITSLKENFNYFPFNVFFDICNYVAQWKWGTNYNFLHNMKNEAVPAALLQTETRDYEDAGMLINSPYISVLRKERNIDLIISLDFSEGDPFMTVTETAKSCKDLNIKFPEIHIPDEDKKKPKDFYVFKGQNTPTVIHIPLFNQVNCEEKLEDFRTNYKTDQPPYNEKMIKDLVEVSGKNISNNIDKLKEEIRAVIKQK